MELLAWVLVFIGFSIVSSIKELMYSREDRQGFSLAYALASFAFMAIAVYLTWKGMT
jgi:hypothetical protein